jgi:predicted RNase H-like HicB family nuclease
MPDWLQGTFKIAAYMGKRFFAPSPQTTQSPLEKSMREFSVIIERDEEGWFVATVPGLRGCHTQAKSLDQLVERVKEAIELCLEVEMPSVNEFIGVQRVAVAA